MNTWTNGSLGWQGDSDAAGPLSDSFERLAQMPMVDRMKNGKDLGEMMVVAHAATQAERGYDVTVLIGDRGGQLLASHESHQLDRLRTAEPQTGHLHMITSVTVLERSIASRHLPDHEALRKLYARMGSLDDGLLPLEMTSLLDSACWSANR